MLFKNVYVILLLSLRERVSYLSAETFVLGIHEHGRGVNTNTRTCCLNLFRLLSHTSANFTDEIGRYVVPCGSFYI